MKLAIPLLIPLALCAEQIRKLDKTAINKVRNETPVIKIKGNQFFYSNNGTRFFIKGIAYQPTLDPGLLAAQREAFLKEQGASVGLQAAQLAEAKLAEERATNRQLVEVESQTLESELFSSTPRYHDPLADTVSCLRDIPYLKELNVNTIRVYSINPELNHDICMNALQEAGIYVMSDLAEPYVSINRENPSWNTEIFDRYKSVVEALGKYPNVLGFFAGNEVTNDITNTNASPFVKAAIRDIKIYMRHRNFRPIPVGYASNDDPQTRLDIARYFMCGNSTESADFYGVNMYEWCGYSSIFSSGYSDRTVEFQNSTIPMFFSEFGCNLVRPRPFQEVEALFSPLMTSVWSGGIAYMYHEEDNKYGVVKVDHQKNSVKKLDDFRYLRDAFKNAKPKITTTKDVFPLKKEVQCPVGPTWKATTKLPETPLNFKCECMMASLDCLVSPKKGHNFHKLYQELCFEVDCTDIKSDGELGEYGFYSGCDDKQKLSFLLNSKYQQTKDINVCLYNGNGVINKNPTPLQNLNTVSKNSQTCGDFLKDYNISRRTGGKNPSTGYSENTSRGKKSGAQRNADKIGLTLAVFVVFLFLSGV